MADVPRRRALLAAASGIAALAGCAGSETASNTVSSRGRPVDDYELEKARDENGGALVGGEDGLPSLSADERARHRRTTRRVLVADEDLSELTFAETDAGERLRSFLAATDFGSASAYLLAMPVRACREIRFRSVSVNPGELADDDLHPHANFCQAYRPADVECDPEATHTVGFAIRIPVVADRSTGSGSGMRGSCRGREPPAVFNASSFGSDGDDA
ncbi:hypothetical protein C463_05310 [Halorubrum californiense DSM 19288]|uniref:Uncharacterized protein n=1 Tax=Halorubrum californiense DSM 19288 TaxID=1227465 RepID=M0EFG8_9EURY|nr:MULTISPECIES: hypothetical protein [Halorubrum]ELZ45828.1 hypothetical protein C463_05310 [Halorubrum californiense DSM 19288]TKX69050.1 hypothetical protein EXE40_11380 [Halorubrum sp. GN11GM_10-3_MGM]